MDGLTVSEAAARTGWSPGCCATSRARASSFRGGAASGYRLYGLRELNQLRSLARAAERASASSSTEVAFAARLRREPRCAAAVETWLAGDTDVSARWVEWEQRKHERLLAARNSTTREDQWLRRSATT